MSNQAETVTNKKVSVPLLAFVLIYFFIGIAFIVYQIIGLVADGPNFWNFLFLALSIPPLIAKTWEKNALARNFFRIVDTAFEFLVIGYSLNSVLFRHGGFWDILFGLAFATTFIINAKRKFSTDPMNINLFKETTKVTTAHQ